MPKYTVNHDYRSVDNGRPFVFTAGTVVELDSDRAAWVNRDSPGTLEDAGHTCDVCGETFKSARALGGHKSAHRDDG